MFITTTHNCAFQENSKKVVQIFTALPSSNFHTGRAMLKNKKFYFLAIYANIVKMRNFN